MIKKSIFLVMLFAAIGCVSAQSLRFEWNGHIYSEGETIECTNDEYGIGEYIQHMQIRNLTSSDQNVVVEKEVMEDLEGTSNTFCWAGNCFGPGTIVSPASLVPANGLNTDDLSFHVTFEEQVFGVVVMRYYAYDERHPDERISIMVKFHKSGAGLAENSRPMTMSRAYPNPASTVVHFNYSFDGNLTAVVYNLLGQEVLREELNANDGQMSLSVADLQAGIYFCTMMVNGRAWTTQKFVVKK
jgi:hypothetical protein